VQHAFVLVQKHKSHRATYLCTCTKKVQLPAIDHQTAQK